MIIRGSVSDNTNALYTLNIIDQIGGTKRIKLGVGDYLGTSKGFIQAENTGVGALTLDLNPQGNPVSINGALSQPGASLSLNGDLVANELRAGWLSATANFGPDSGAKDFVYYDTADGAGTLSNERFRIQNTTGYIAIGTSTPNYMITSHSATAPQLSLSAGAGNAQWTLRNAGGNLYFSTTTATITATSTLAGFTIQGSNNATAIATTTLNGMLNLGTAPSTNGTSTIQMGKIQWDGYDSAGSRICVYFVGINLTAQTGACNP